MMRSENTEQFKPPVDVVKKELQTEVVQLRKEATIDREKTSITVVDMIKFCEDNKAKDQLMHGVPEPNNWEESKKPFFFCC